MSTTLFQTKLNILPLPVSFTGYIISVESVNGSNVVGSKPISCWFTLYANVPETKKLLNVFKKVYSEILINYKNTKVLISSSCLNFKCAQKAEEGKQSA